MSVLDSMEYFRLCIYALEFQSNPVRNRKNNYFIAELNTVIGIQSINSTFSQKNFNFFFFFAYEFLP